MTKALKSEIQALTAELASHVGRAQADHTLWLAEHNWATSVKVGGKAFLVGVRNSMLSALTYPRSVRVVQTSPETQAWGGFLSQDVFYVVGKPLREVER
jgi:hypothetical protein